MGLHYSAAMAQLTCFNLETMQILSQSNWESMTVTVVIVL